MTPPSNASTLAAPIPAVIATDPLLLEHMHALGLHLIDCRLGAWPLRLRCASERLYAWTTRRLFTTVGTAALTLAMLIAASHWI